MRITVLAFAIYNDLKTNPRRINLPNLASAVQSSTVASGGARRRILTGRRPDIGWTLSTECPSSVHCNDSVNPLATLLQ